MSTNTQPSMIKALISKDLHLNKKNLLLFSALGLFSVYLLSFNSRVFYVGLTLLLSIVILIGASLVTTTVVNERKNKTLAFLMTLPINCMDYTKAKIIVNLGSYLVAWLLLTATTISVIVYSPHLPNGLIPYALIILIELMVAFVIILATALITESELWTIVVMTITNICVSIFMFFIASIENIKQHMESVSAVWNSTAITIIGIELLVAAVALAITFVLQSKKKDFI